MHALPQPLIHRDLKVRLSSHPARASTNKPQIENILSAPISSPPTTLRPTPLIFKLCDFGSTTIPATRPPSSKAEADALAMDLNRHTTLQYRSPEMVEPLLGWPVGLPSGQSIPFHALSMPAFADRDNRRLGIGRVALQVVLLYYAVRGAWHISHCEC